MYGICVGVSVDESADSLRQIKRIATRGPKTTNISLGFLCSSVVPHNLHTVLRSVMFLLLFLYPLSLFMCAIKLISTLCPHVVVKRS